MDKRKRLAVLHEIEDTLDGYCRVCPFQGGNTAHRNCNHCPVNGQLREYGRQLGWEYTNGQQGHTRWTEAEDRYLRRNLGHLSMVRIAKDLGRGYASVTKRVERLKQNGQL